MTYLGKLLSREIYVLLMLQPSPVSISMISILDFAITVGYIAAVKHILIC